VRHDYEGFFDFELEGRKRFHYPPFYRIILLTFRHKYKDRTEAAARLFAQNLSKELGPYIIGPAEPVVNRVRQMYLTELMLKLPKEASLIRNARKLLAQQFAIIGNDKVLRSVIIDTDADPV
jgi:primosomal protein N' (replication factor Y)